jgi:hypothetical protein
MDGDHDEFHCYRLQMWLKIDPIDPNLKELMEV